MIKFTIPSMLFFDLDIGHFFVNVDRYNIYIYISYIIWRTTDNYWGCKMM